MISIRRRWAWQPLADSSHIITPRCLFVKRFLQKTSSFFGGFNRRTSVSLGKISADVRQRVGGVNARFVIERQVRQAHHTAELPVFDHRQAAHLLPAHEMGGNPRIHVRGGGDHPARHHICYRGGGRGPARRQAPGHNIPVRHQAAHPPVAAAHRQASDIIPGQGPGGYCHRLLRPDPYHRICHYFPNFHKRSLLPRLWTG